MLRYVVNLLNVVQFLEVVEHADQSVRLGRMVMVAIGRAELSLLELQNLPALAPGGIAWSRGS